MLQCRRGNRTPWAALRISVDLVNEGLIDRATALKRLEGFDLASIGKNVLLPESGAQPIGRGIPASIGVAVGQIAFDAEVARSRERNPQILVRRDILTEDIRGMASCAGILTSSGGRTSHAAVVARQMNKVCIVGCRDLTIDSEHKTCSFGDKVLRDGDYISLDGNSGDVYAGKAKINFEKPTELIETIARWKFQSAMLA